MCKSHISLHNSERYFDVIIVDIVTSRWDTSQFRASWLPATLCELIKLYSKDGQTSPQPALQYRHSPQVPSACETLLWQIRERASSRLQNLISTVRVSPHAVGSLPSNTQERETQRYYWHELVIRDQKVLLNSNGNCGIWFEVIHIPNFWTDLRGTEQGLFLQFRVLTHLFDSTLNESWHVNGVSWRLVSYCPGRFGFIACIRHVRMSSLIEPNSYKSSAIPHARHRHLNLSSTLLLP